MRFDRQDVLLRYRRIKAARRRRRQAGMTLLELLVVITVLGLLTAAVGTVALNYLGRAKTETTQLRINQLEAGLDLFRLDMGRYPTEAEGLRALIEAPADAEKWNGPYVKKAEAIDDAWGTPFLYASPGQHGEVDIYSLGADKADGGEDEDQDVTNW
ncbi:type II secretion system major pseudopilin GspG [Pelagibius sp. CAU 1746]|uniref:type II secretion system major pseudopilin GspG n=1 Tax=Pelagibius sp. CAU 1746 TaxID=3140370 RepID=UPI00325AD717